MIKFPIVDVKRYQDGFADKQVTIIKFLCKNNRTILKCPCVVDDDGDDIEIGSDTCRYQCLYKQFYDYTNQEVYCSHDYWINELEREFYKNNEID